MPVYSPDQPPYVIEIRNASRVIVGQIDLATQLTLKPAYNSVGSWSVTMPDGTPQAALIAKGGWVTFTTPAGVQLIAGQIRGLKRTWDESNPFGGTLTIYGPSAEQVIADRVAYQVPSSAATSQAGADYDRRSGVAETIIKQYVNLNAGPGALSARQTGGLTIETDAARGTSVKGSARMTPLLDLIAGLAQAGGLGFRVVFSGTSLQFQMYVPVDRTGTALFGKDLGNLVSYEQTDEAPKSSAAIVGGSGTGTARVFNELDDTATSTTWGGIRSETFVDQSSTSDTAELAQAANNEVVTNGPVSGLSVQTRDTPHLRFAADYFLGDKVTVIGATTISDVLRTVQIDWQSGQAPKTTSTVGTASTTGTPKMIARLAALNAIVAKLQANK